MQFDIKTSEIEISLKLLTMHTQSERVMATLMIYMQASVVMLQKKMLAIVALRS
jgi:hypothetical protein